MSKQTKIYLLVSACILQVLILLGMVIGVNYIYIAGKTYTMKATGYDPYDPLRGRYIQLKINEEILPLKSDEEIPVNARSSDTPLYAVFSKEAEGGKLAYCTFHRPVNENYLKLDEWEQHPEQDKMFIGYFKAEQYYVNEKMAEDLEMKIRETEEVYLQIQVHKGIYVVKRLVIDGESY